jgi:hypothetical protein
MTNLTDISSDASTSELYMYEYLDSKMEAYNEFIAELELMGY